MTAQLLRTNSQDSLSLLPDTLIWDIVALATGAARLQLSMTCQAFRRKLYPTLWSAVLVHDEVITADGQRVIAEYSDCYDAIPIGRDRVQTASMPSHAEPFIKVIVAMRSDRKVLYHDLASMISSCCDLQTLIFKQYSAAQRLTGVHDFECLETALDRYYYLRQLRCPDRASIIVHCDSLCDSHTFNFLGFVLDHIDCNITLAFGKLDEYTEPTRNLLRRAATTEVEYPNPTPKFLMIGGDLSIFEDGANLNFVESGLHLRDVRGIIGPRLRHRLCYSDEESAQPQAIMTFSYQPAETLCNIAYSISNERSAKVEITIQTNDPKRAESILGLVLNP